VFIRDESGWFGTEFVFAVIYFWFTVHSSIFDSRTLRRLVFLINLLLDKISS
jgi:hypothetical protein